MVTYLLQGNVERGDSLGNKGVIEVYDVQWMTAGSGIIHQEMPRGETDGRLWGLQLWADLPSARKTAPPQYREIKKEAIPTIDLETGARIRVISGEMGSVQGPVKGITGEPEFYDISLPPHSSIEHSFPVSHTVFVYILEERDSSLPITPTCRSLNT